MHFCSQKRKGDVGARVSLTVTDTLVVRCSIGGPAGRRVSISAPTDLREEGNNINGRGEEHIEMPVNQAYYVQA